MNYNVRPGKFWTVTTDGHHYILNILCKNKHLSEGDLKEFKNQLIAPVENQTYGAKIYTGKSGGRDTDDMWNYASDSDSEVDEMEIDD